MASQEILPPRAMRTLIALSFAFGLSLNPFGEAKGQGSAAQLLKEGSSYQSADDTSDRAAEAYSILIQKYPRTSQAEQAQFFLGTYYHKKFHILEHKVRTEDWSSFNKAESALYAYVGQYQRGSYVADAYLTLALISLRRGYNDKHRDNAISLLKKMSEQKADGLVYIYKVVWSPYSDDVVKRYCAKSSLASSAIILINRNTTFGNFSVALREWARNNCK